MTVASPTGGTLQGVRTWGEMIKFSHSIFALPFALLSTFLATRPKLPTAIELGLIVLCMVAARSAAMTFNRLVDTRFDALNPRTANRALATGAIRPAAAWGFFILAAIFFIAGCAGFWVTLHSPWPLLLSVPTLALLCFYSYTKRFTRFSHLVLGAVIAFAPVAAWIALRPDTLGPTAWWLMLAGATWIAGFDIIYSCLDAQFDRNVGLHSLPARLGVGCALWIARGLHVATVSALLLVGWSAALGTIYFLGVCISAILIAVEHSLVRANDLSRVNLAFFTLNGIVGLVLGILGIADIVTA